MKRICLFVILCVCASPSRAQNPFADVPRGHWSYACASRLFRTGLFSGFPDGALGRKRLMTRYEFAVIVLRSVGALESWMRPLAGHPRSPQGPVFFPLSDRDFDCLQCLITEYRSEIVRMMGSFPDLERTLSSARMDASLSVSAMPPEDRKRRNRIVPEDHWARASVARLQERWPLPFAAGSADEAWMQPHTRLEYAAATIRMLEALRVNPYQTDGTPISRFSRFWSPDEVEDLHRLVDEFRPEMLLLQGQVQALLGVKPDSLHEAIRFWRAQRAQCADRDWAISVPAFPTKESPRRVVVDPPYEYRWPRLGLFP